MALANFTLANVGAATPAIVATSPAPLRVDLDDLLYSPEEQQADYIPKQTGNEPFLLPNSQRRPKVRKRAGTTYLPPPNQYTRYPQAMLPQNPFNSQLHTQLYQQNSRLDIQIENQHVQEVNSQFDNTGQYVHDPSGDYDYEQRRINQNGPHRSYTPGYADSYPTVAAPSSSRRFDAKNQNTDFNLLNRPVTTPGTQPRPSDATKGSNSGQVQPDRPRGFTKVETGSSGGKTQLHAVLDYDEDYYDDIPGPGMLRLALNIFYC